MQFPVTEPVVLTETGDVEQLVRYLRQETRDRPVAILTVAPGQTTPSVPAADVARASQGRVDIVTMPTDELTLAFTDLIKDPRGGVYHGACRVYPPGTMWETDPYSVPLRMARDPREAANQPDLVISDVKRLLHTTSAPSQRAPVEPDGPRPGQPSPRDTAAPGEISSAAGAEALAAHLRDPSRRMPSVVVSRATGTTQAYVDVPQLRNDLAGLADVFEITTLEATWALSHSVPDMCQVYGGASRVYPIGTEWEQDPYLSPLRFAYGRVDRERVTRQLIADALGMATSGSLTLPAADTLAAPVTGEVAGIAGNRVLVNLPGQFPGVVWPELVEPAVAAERLFAKHMPIEGTLDPQTRRIDVGQMRLDTAEAVANYQPGDTILVRVKEVSRIACIVEAFPGRSHTIPAADVAEEIDDLRDLIAAGDVLPALFIELDPGTGEWLLSIADAADAELAVASPAILTGGPPWLVPGSSRTNESHPETAEAPEAESDTTAAEEGPEAETIDEQPTVEVVASLQQERDQLVRTLRRVEAENRSLRDKVEAGRLNRLSVARRKARGSGHLVDDSQLFVDEHDQLDFEIRLAWARMTQPSEKEELALRRWRYSPHFFETLRTVQGVSRDKVVEVIVHVLTGRDVELVSRERHQLRTGRGGEDPPVVRAGGETCWRVNLQTKTASARRLHYWMCTDGSIELGSIRLHDDMQP